MRKKLLLPALLLFAACNNSFTVSPASLDLAAGATATITASRDAPVNAGPPGRTSPVEFTGSGAVSAVGLLGANDPSAVITVQGLMPGTGFVSATGRGTVAIVNVFDCTKPPDLTPHFAAIEGKTGEQAFLRVHPSMEGGSFQWYTGTSLDTTHPIPFSNTPYYIDFTPRTNGSYPFWVRQTTPCGTATAAFVVNVGLSRRRGVAR
jgi:hypothetical protein